ncbi:MAG: hypothetical protein HQL27_06435 [Candidatus Omnitrophica bacterium]|nr:hypothetical protein [Candidatus Omnitrophota bacterium]
MLKIISAFTALFLICGCATIQHLDELLTLKEYSESQEATQKYVADQDAKFKDLLEAVNNGTVEQYKTRKTFRIAFGDSVFDKKVQRNNEEVTESLYRYSTKYFDSDNVYVYFDKKGMLLEWRLEKDEGAKDEPDSN